jgi:hypothetical protein
MTNHRVHYAGLDPHLQARCSCTKKSAIGSRAEVDTWYFAHVAEVERIRTHLGSRNPSLKTQYAWFVKQADDENNPAEDRALWRQLADELERFLASKEPLQQDALF